MLFHLYILYVFFSLNNKDVSELENLIKDENHVLRFNAGNKVLLVCLFSFNCCSIQTTRNEKQLWFMSKQDEVQLQLLVYCYCTDVVVPVDPQGALCAQQHGAKSQSQSR